MGLIAWIKSWFSKAASIVKKLWTLAEPFLKELLSASAKAAFDSLKSLAVEAVTYVATQGLPTDEAKQDAFVAYMTSKAKETVSALSTSELNLLRETALAIYKASQA